MLLLVICNESCQLRSNITAQVSSNGSDDPSCLQSSKSCSTLMYALSRLQNMSGIFCQNTSVVVNVTYNQTISKALEYKFSSLFALNVTVISNNRAFINFENRSILEISQETDCELHWAWIGLGFHRKSHYRPMVLDVYQVNIVSLAILNCKILAAKLEATDSQKIFISNTVFGSGQNGFCPIFLVKTETCDVLFIFTNNTYSSCQHPNSKIPLLGIIVGGRYLTVQAEISNCRFVGLKSISHYREYSYPKQSATSRFANDQSDQISSHVLISSEILNSNCQAARIEVSILQTYFIGNYQMTLMSVSDVIGVHHTVRVRIDHLVITNNRVSTALVAFAHVDDQFSGTFWVVLSNVSIANNSIIVNTRQDQAVVTVVTIGVEPSLVNFSNVNTVKIADSNFAYNNGTPITSTYDSTTDKTEFFFTGDILFMHNYGLLGGACFLHNADISTSATATVTFEENTAILGGALYWSNVILSNSACNLEVNFVNNRATTRGNSVYLATPPDHALYSLNCSVNISIEDVSSIAFDMIETSIPVVIPGQNIYINMSITDYFGSPSFCTANVYLLCDNSVFSCFNKQIRLNGPDYVVLTHSTVDTKLSLSVPQPTLDNTTVSLWLTCGNIAQTSTVVYLNISACPLGFAFNNSKGVCECADIISNHGTVICSENLGIACIAQGYWYGPVNSNDNNTMYVSAPCAFSECSNTKILCPAKMLSLGFWGRYYLLGYHSDEQCSIGRGGLLCRSCAPGYQYTFLSVTCVASSVCSWWQPYLVLAISFVFEIMIAVLLLACVRFKLATGSGFLYGPMLLLAVVSRLPFEMHPQYFILRISVLFITAIPLLNLEPFGLIPFCFFQPFNKIYNYSLRYLSPFSVLLVIGFTTLKARWCPQTLSLWQHSRLKALCILMLLSFWSLADITMNVTINILTPTKLTHDGAALSWVVELEPDMKFFSPEHLPVVILALIVLVAVIAPLLIILLFSPLLSKVINLTKIKPFLDEFQSCYKDNCRWYSGVYFVVWVSFVSLQRQAISVIYVQTLFMILLSAHFVIQPYQSRVLNITDMLILADINFLLFLTSFNPNLATIILVHVLVLGPIVCFGICLICVLLVKCGLWHWFYKVVTRRGSTSPRHVQDEEYSKPSQVSVQEVFLYDDSEREPLIGIVNDV